MTRNPPVTQPARPAPGQQPPASARPVGDGTVAGATLLLQRAAGNRAVAAALSGPMAGPRPGVPLQRRSCCSSCSSGMKCSEDETEVHPPAPKEEAGVAQMVWRSPEASSLEVPPEMEPGDAEVEELKTVPWKIKPGKGGANDLLNYQCDPAKTLKVQVVTAAASEVVAPNIENAKKVLARHSIDLAVDRKDLNLTVAPAQTIDDVCAIAAQMGKPETGKLPVLFIPLGAVDRDGGINGFYDADLKGSCSSSAFTSVAFVGTKTTCNGTMLHEIGHATGNGHVGGRGDEENVMNGCRPGTDRTVLNQNQLRKFCQTEFD